MLAHKLYELLRIWRAETPPPYFYDGVFADFASRFIWRSIRDRYCAKSNS